MAIEVARIDHVQVTVPRAAEAAARAFYGEVLGLREIAKPRELRGRGGAWYAAGGTELHLSLEDLPPAAAHESRRHVCLVVADLDVARRALAAAGVEILPDDRPVAGWARFYVRDPGGNRLELARPLAAR
jgi:catechol 2,3-dioxygenase-like lactoylglutathione lyase family enzyme